MVLIGLCGIKGSGKSTVATYLSDFYGFNEYTFASPIREIVKTMFLISEWQLSEPELKEKCIDDYFNVTPRKAMQFVGTELVREHIGELLPHIGSDFWIEHLFRRMLKNGDVDSNVVISDVRFQNEADKIRSLGGVIVKIIRPSIYSLDSHSSENGDIAPDYVVDNVTDFRSEVSKLMEKLGV